MQIEASEETRSAVGNVMRKGFGGKFDGIKTDGDLDHDGYDCLRITVHLSKDAKRADSKGFFGWTAHVRTASGGKNSDLFRYIRPTGQPFEEANA